MTELSMAQFDVSAGSTVKCVLISSINCLPALDSQRSGVTMSIFAYRKHLRFLSETHRRQWWDQRKRLTPRVRISGAYVPPNVTREFAYVKVG
ncbi:hypothetical protein ASG35_01690 [Burkholderia sp. Leaf177]|nr:hypothetical protein ASG35_01690 [Burkholderia sp. Leaf177]